MFLEVSQREQNLSLNDLVAQPVGGSSPTEDGTDDAMIAE